MEERMLKYDDAPMGYAVCFNKQCARCETCLRYRVGLLAPASRLAGMAVFPQAWREGDCSAFRPAQPAVMAWGFTHLFDRLPRYKRPWARAALRRYFGNGMSTYYRYHYGHKMLSPVRQQEVMTLLASYGSTDGVRFDHYVVAYDFT